MFKNHKTTAYIVLDTYTHPYMNFISTKFMMVVVSEEEGRTGWEKAALIKGILTPCVSTPKRVKVGCEINMKTFVHFN